MDLYWNSRIPPAPLYPAVRVRNFLLPASVLLQSLSRTSFNESIVPKAKSFTLKMTSGDLVCLSLCVAGNGHSPEIAAVSVKLSAVEKPSRCLRTSSMPLSDNLLTWERESETYRWGLMIIFGDICCRLISSSISAAGSSESLCTLAARCSGYCLGTLRGTSQGSGAGR